ncbi:MAG: RNA-binding protein [Spirochaetaceae bacterium]|nr:MAG: RNA-binding protein [Spirochaetaceae bacterium]
MARYRYIEDPEELKETIQGIVKRIHDEEDPHEMNEYKRFIKKHVSVFSRAYFTAHLLKQLARSEDSSPRRRSRPAPSRRAAEQDPSPGDDLSAAGGGERTDGDQQTLFVSIGKNRRVFPKDFITLITELDGVSGEQIGQIKILDSYSFVEVESSIADRVIETYNGYEYRGRKLTVNYARSRKN